MTVKFTRRASEPASALAPSLAGALAVVAGGVVLVGWAFGIAALKSILPGWVAVKPNTGFAFVLTGVAFLFAFRTSSTFRTEPSGFVPRVIQVCALLAGLTGLLTIGEYLFGRSLVIDQWLFRESPGAVGTSDLGRMAPDTAVCFVLLAAALWLAASARNRKRAAVASVIAGALVTFVAVDGILAFFSLGLRTHGWWGLTMMAPLTASVFACLGATMIFASWQDSLGSWMVQFSSHLWLTLGCVGALTVAFTVYAQSEGETDQANELRHRSLLLAEELRQSEDDLTRMARTYVVTGDPINKKYFQDILDIRDGRKPRPDDYTGPYWDLMLGDGPAPLAGQPAVPLLDLMRQAGFTGEELRKLAEARARSAGITALELEAMKLVESTGPDAEADRAWARTMMFDGNYQQARAAVMRPIADLLLLIDRRTDASVRRAEHIATIFRYVFAAVGFALMFVLWGAYVTLRNTLGGSLDDVSAHIARIGSGEFSRPIQVSEGLADSVAGWLSQTQAKLSESDRARTLAAAAQRAIEEQFRSMFERASVGIAQADPDTGRFLHVNEKMSAITGYSIDELLGMRSADITHPDDREKDWEAFQRVVRGEATEYRLEKRYVRKDGELMWVNVNMTVVRDAAGQPVRTMATIEDITERKRAEDEVSRTKDRLDFALQVSGTGAWDLDLLDHAAHRSLQHDRIFGYQTLLPVWTYEMFLEHVLPEDRAEVDRQFSVAVSDRSDWSFECRIRRYDGEVRWIWAAGRHRFDLSGGARQMSGIVQDITDRKQAQIALLQLNTDLEQRIHDRTSLLEAANKDLEAFSYSVSHDLRAPIRAIDGYSRILLEDHQARLDAEGRRVLGVISSETRRMGQLIDDLLAFSRLGRQKLASSGIDMTAMARAAFDDLTAQEPKRIVQLHMTPLVPARGDRALIRVVFDNLISNAVKFTQPRNPAVIEIGCRQDDGEVVYHVKDNGVGFDPNYAHKLFGVFQRLHSEQEFEGTGVGLALVQRVVHRHGGRVWADGQIDEGATFYFSLPHKGDDHE